MIFFFHNILSNNYGILSSNYDILTNDYNNFKKDTNNIKCLNFFKIETNIKLDALMYDLYVITNGSDVNLPIITECIIGKK